ncbi:MAG: hypothetical protein BWZ10_02594 [candidate division BRC1 bacterium ADurb.BinA364]|nr:MAG: hypothetical protein BWZ10_02594 [candidate division BRC1 bacterium ADurb.BinA364]
MTSCNFWRSLALAAAFGSASIFARADSRKSHSGCIFCRIMTPERARSAPKASASGSTPPGTAWLLPMASIQGRSLEIYRQSPLRPAIGSLSFRGTRAMTSSLTWRKSTSPLAIAVSMRSRSMRYGAARLSTSLPFMTLRSESSVEPLNCKARYISGGADAEPADLSNPGPKSSMYSAKAKSRTSPRVASAKRRRSSIPAASLVWRSVIEAPIAAFMSLLAFASACFSGAIAGSRQASPVGEALKPWAIRAVSRTATKK